MPVIPVSREVSRGGGHIAENAAHALSHHFVDKNLTERILKGYDLIGFRVLGKQAPAEEHTTASIEADPVLAQVVSEVLGCSGVHRLQVHTPQ